MCAKRKAVKSEVEELKKLSSRREYFEEDHQEEGTDLLEVYGLKKIYKNGVEAVKNVTLKMYKG